MHGLRELENPYACHWSDEFQKIRTTFSEKPASLICGPVCHPSTFIDLANTTLADRRSVKTICVVLGSDSTHMDVTGPMNFEKRIEPLFRKIVLPGFCSPQLPAKHFY